MSNQALALASFGWGSLIAVVAFLSCGAVFEPNVLGFLTIYEGTLAGFSYGVSRL